jgi:hypothetical protein
MSYPGNKMLRNAESDIGGLTQWIARKCRNHNPLVKMKERKLRNKHAEPTLGIDIASETTAYYELAYRETIPVAADGSFDKQIRVPNGGGYGLVRLFGNVKAREFHTVGAGEICKYNGISWEVMP